MLAITDFPAFFHAIWGYPPFDWQVRLLERVRTEGWPSTLDLPTGSGKTSALDIALFALALDASLAPEERNQPRRIALVVDRRVVVDQAYERAVRLASALRDAEEGVLAATAGALRALQKDERALPVLPAILRGGMPRESEWARTPYQPVLLVSTVDQVGSRLLFRGYGVSDGMRPVHAGLLGCDTLYLLDEVHLSRPFEETLDAVRHYSARSNGSELSRPLVFVRMSATVAERRADSFRLSADDEAQETLARRLRASKVATLSPVEAPKSPPRAREALAKACVAEAVRLSEGRGRVVALIVNRVDTARRAAALARSELGSEWDVRLLTGRMRPLDREELQRGLDARIRAGRTRNPDDRVLLVSTQAIEAGADLDFDALVTECASLDALRQRFGRLDRLGELETTRAAVLACASEVAEEAQPDPIYGEALRATWRWLSELAELDGTNEEAAVDFGINALDARLERLDANERAALLAPRAFAPVLIGSHLDRWAQTSPVPSADPDVAPFLHGPERGAPDVQIVWRADLEASTLEATEPGRLRTQLGLVPPSALEALAVPLGAARSWLAAVAARLAEEPPETATAAPPVADVEGVGEAAGDGTPSTRTDRGAPAVVWRGERTALLDRDDPGDLYPGATLVVPASYGGLDPVFRCWSPEATEPVPDRGDEANLRQRGRAVVRWSPPVLASWSLRPELANGPRLERPDEGEDELDPAVALAAFDDWRREVLDEGEIPAWVRLALETLDRQRKLVRLGEGVTEWRATRSNRRLPHDALRPLSGMAVFEAQPSDVAATEDDEGSFTGDGVPLERHLEDVRVLTRRFADALSLPAAIASDLELAASLHDLGKCDPRFQLMLHAGDPVAQALAEAPLAKSVQALTAGDAEARARARERSGYPAGKLHELTSVALIEESADLRERARDWDLVLHLVASHHGQGRPLGSRPAHDPDPVEVVARLGGFELTARSDHALERFDSGVADRYWRLLHRHGWWGLAWLEAILRLADHRASEQEAGR